MEDVARADRLLESLPIPHLTHSIDEQSTTPLSHIGELKYLSCPAQGWYIRCEVL